MYLLYRYSPKNQEEIEYLFEKLFSLPFAINIPYNSRIGKFFHSFDAILCTFQKIWNNLDIMANKSLSLPFKREEAYIAADRVGGVSFFPDNRQPIVQKRLPLLLQPFLPRLRLL